MSDHKRNADLRRRGFLLAGGIGAAGAVAVAVAPAIKQVAPVAAKAVPEGSGYRDNERVQQYYDTTRV
jgi:Rieske Fe-S protein